MSHLNHMDMLDIDMHESFKHSLLCIVCMHVCIY